MYICIVIAYDSTTSIDLVPKNRDISFMIWLRTGFHGDDQINKLRITRNLFRSGSSKQQKEGKGTDRREKNKTKKGQRKKLHHA